MAEEHKKKSRRGNVSHVGLALFHAISKMTTLHEPDELAKGDGEVQERTFSFPASDEADELERNNGAVEGKDNGSKGDKTGKTEEAANLVSLEILALMRKRLVRDFTA